MVGSRVGIGLDAVEISMRQSADDGSNPSRSTWGYCCRSKVMKAIS